MLKREQSYSTQPFRPGRSGFVLIYILSIATILFLLVGAVLSLYKQQLFISRTEVDRSRALYAAQAGLSYAIAQLEEDPSWTSGYNHVMLPGNTAGYSLQFAANPSTAGPLDSINNLNGVSAVDSYLGTGTVPSHSALLIVTGYSGTAVKTVEALVVVGASPLKDVAIAATGTLHFRGNAKIDGVDDLTSSSSSLPSGIYSDLAHGTAITYAPRAANPSDQFIVTGKIMTQSDSATAIDLSGNHSVGGIETGVPPKLFPHPNIAAILQSHSTVPGPSIPSTPGLVTLTGDNYYPSDVTIQGDLTLNGGAKLYVNGKLTVNGSVTGNGGIIASGDVSLYGNADVAASQNDYISIMTSGNVILKGFQGESFMESLVSGNAEATQRWNELKWALQQIQNYLITYSALTPQQLGQQMQSDDHKLDSYMSIISRHDWGDPAFVGKTYRDSSSYFKNLIGNGPPLSTQKFLYQRFQTLGDLFRDCWHTRNAPLGPGTSDVRWSGGVASGIVLDNFAQYDPNLDGGIFDNAESWNVINTPQRAQVLQDIIQMINQVSYEQPGSALFKGFIYAEGVLAASDDLNVYGTVIINGNPNRPPLNFRGKTYNPGDVIIADHSRLIYVDTMFRHGVENLAGIGSLEIKHMIIK